MKDAKYTREREATEHETKQSATVMVELATRGLSGRCASNKKGLRPVKHAKKYYRVSLLHDDAHGPKVGREFFAGSARAVAGAQQQELHGRVKQPNNRQALHRHVLGIFARARARACGGPV